MSASYELHGSGDNKILLMPDWFGGPAYYKSFFEWADLYTYQYALVHFRGYGKAEAAAGEFTLAEMVGDALAIVDTLGWERFHAVGHSMSGKALQLLAQLYSDRLITATALTPTPPAAVPLDEGTRGLLEACENDAGSRVTALSASMGGQYTDHFFRRVAELSISASTAEAFAGYLRAWADTDITRDLAVCDLPLKVVVGAHDAFVGLEDIRQQLSPKFPKAEFVVFEESGHYPILEEPVKTVSLIESHATASAT